MRPMLRKKVLQKSGRVGYTDWTFVDESKEKSLVTNDGEVSNTVFTDNSNNERTNDSVSTRVCDK